MHAIRLYPPALRAVGTAQDTSARAAGGRGRLRLAHARLLLGRLPHAACRTSFSTRCAVAGATPATATGSAARDERWSHVSGLLSRARATGDALELEQEHLPLDARGACHRSPTPRLPLPLLALRGAQRSVAIERGGGRHVPPQHRADLPTRPCVSRDRNA